MVRAVGACMVALSRSRWHSPLLLCAPVSAFRQRCVQ